MNKRASDRKKLDVEAEVLSEHDKNSIKAKNSDIENAVAFSIYGNPY